MDWRDIKWDREKEPAGVAFLQMKIQMINSGNGDKTPSVQEWLDYHNSNSTKDNKPNDKEVKKAEKKAERAKQRRRVKQAAKFFDDIYEKEIEVKDLRGKYASALKKSIDKYEDKYEDDDIDLDRAERMANKKREREREKKRREQGTQKGNNLKEYLNRLYNNVVLKAKTREGQAAMFESFTKINDIINLSTLPDDEKLQILYNWRGETGVKGLEDLIAAIYDEYYNISGDNHTVGSDASRNIYAKELQHLARSLGVNPTDPKYSYIFYQWTNF